MGRRMAAVVAPLAAGVSVLALGTGTARAATVSDTRSVTYRTFTGVPVTCQLTSRQVFDPARSDEAYAEVGVEGPAGCEQADVSIAVTYLAPGRLPASGTVRGRTAASGTWEPVADDFRSRHSVHFDDCDVDRDRCDFDVTLVQPK